MLSDDVLSRLSELNRARVPFASPDDDGEPTAERQFTEFIRGTEGGEDVSRLPRGTEVENGWGKHWLRERPVCEIWPQGERWLKRQMARLDPPSLKATGSARELQTLIGALPENVLYLDLETCGFAGSMVFLVGLVHQREARFVLTQLLARNYAEEKPMLQTLWTLAAQKSVLATFNGKSFDWPMVHDRSTIHHLGCDMRGRSHTSGSPAGSRLAEPLRRDDPRPDPVHCDLLHHARRRWKNRLPDCKLQTLEQYVCRRTRTDDIPGREIPSAYHDFVRSNDAWLIRSVLHHNALDLVTLLQLSIAVAGRPS